MLDLDHPMTTHRFTAAHLDDYLMTHVKWMTLASTEERQKILPKCHEALQKLRQLNDDHFSSANFIIEAIEELQFAINELAALKTQLLDGNAYAIKVCPACGTLLTRVQTTYMPKPEQRWSVYCHPCLKMIGPPRQKLDSDQGFGTWAI